MMSTKCTRVLEPMQTRVVLVSSFRKWRGLRTYDETWPLLFLKTVHLRGILFDLLARCSRVRIAFIDDIRSSLSM
jgi:hypothetical protein